ncbi:MAG: imidazole glycerol phosphate synthase subunit HisF [Promethearchaeota archaeon]
MLAKRIIPCLDMIGGRVVKGVRFVNIRDAGDPPELAVLYENQGADEIVFLDITASHEKRDILIDVVNRTSDQLFIPFTVGGGIRSLKDIQFILKAGADKITINTTAVKSPEIIKKSSEVFGSQCIVSAIDAKRVYVDENNPPKDLILGKTAQGLCWWEVYIYGGRKATGIDAIQWAKKVEELGAGEIMLTSMDFDGTKDGYDIPMTKEVVQRTNIPIIASGGGGIIQHFIDVFKKADCSAALAASIFHFREIDILRLKKELMQKQIPIRLKERKEMN